MQLKHTSSEPRTVTVNGEPRTTRAASLAGLLEELGFAGAKVATAINGDFVPERNRAAHEVRAGDHIEVVAPRQGG